MDEKEFLKILFQALNDEDIDKISNTLYYFYNNPVLLLDIDYNIIFQLPNNKINDYVWDSILDKKTVSADLSKEIGLKEYQKALDECNRILLLDYGIGGKVPRYILTIEKNKNVIGYFCIILEKEQKIDSNLLLMVSDILSVYISKISLYSLKNIEQIFINNLISGFYNDRNTILKWIKRTQTVLNESYILVSFKVSRKSNEIVFLHQMGTYVKNRLRNCYSTIIENYLYVLVSNIDDCKNYKILLNHIINEINDFKLRSGVSMPFNDLFLIPAYKYQAERALIIDKTREVCFFEDIKIENMLSYAKADLKLYNCINPALEILINYDKQNQTDYYLTLRAYLSNFKDSKKTCMELIIHRNTLLYRIGKIEELCHISLDDNNTSLELLCNYYMFKYNPRM